MLIASSPLSHGSDAAAIKAGAQLADGGPSLRVSSSGHTSVAIARKVAAAGSEREAWASSEAASSLALPTHGSIIARERFSKLVVRSGMRQVGIACGRHPDSGDAAASLPEKRNSLRNSAVGRVAARTLCNSSINRAMRTPTVAQQCQLPIAHFPAPWGAGRNGAPIGQVRDVERDHRRLGRICQQHLGMCSLSRRSWPEWVRRNFSTIHRLAVVGLTDKQQVGHALFFGPRKTGLQPISA